MEYAIKEIARVIGAKTNQLLDDTVSLLLTDSRRLSFPEKSLFFALKTKTNDGHRYIERLATDQKAGGSNPLTHANKK